MGAILAILGEAGDPELSERLQRMLARSPYRGEPEFVVEGPLAIGIQSMGWDASLHSAGNWLVAFHGYIGNWGELAPGFGLRFPENASNAHRIAIAYEALGDVLFAKVRGEWAVLIMDREGAVLIAATDVGGLRPLFTTQKFGRRCIATEVRQVLTGIGMHPELAENVLVEHMLGGHPQSPETFVQGVSLVVPGDSSRFSTSNPCEARATSIYWKPPEGSDGVDTTRAMEELRFLLERAVTRSLPDIPFAVTLSGGLDSGAIWSLVSRAARSGVGNAALGSAYSLLYPGFSCDETELISRTLRATSTDAVTINVAEERPFDAYPRLVEAVDAPFYATLHQIPMIATASVADGRRIVLTGIGGDQWMNGSLRHLQDDLLAGRLVRFIRDARAVMVPEGSSRLDYLRRHGFDVNSSLILRRLRERRPEWLSPNRWRAYRLSRDPDLERRPVGCSRGRLGLFLAIRGQRTRSPLVSIEQCFSVHGVEIRSPLMDLDLVKFAFTMPARVFTSGIRYKELMRGAVTDLLPISVRDHVKTPGFGEVIARDWDAFTREVRRQPWELVQRGLIDAAGLDNMVLGTTMGSRSRSRLINTLLISELFARRFRKGSF